MTEPGKTQGKTPSRLHLLGLTLHRSGEVWRGRGGPGEQVELTVWRRTYSSDTKGPRWECIALVGSVRDGANGATAEEAAREAMRAASRAALRMHRLALGMMV